MPEIAQFNQTIHELQERDNSEELVSVVKLYVADRAAGMLLLQDILAENEILSDSDSKLRAASSRKSALLMGKFAAEDAIESLRKRGSEPEMLPIRVPA